MDRHDGGYGQYGEVRDWATERSRRYVMAVPSTQPLARVHGIGGQAGVAKAGDLLERATRWERRSCGHAAKGERFYDWAFFTVALPDEPAADGFTHTLMIRRRIADPTQVASFLVPWDQVTEDDQGPDTPEPDELVISADFRGRVRHARHAGFGCSLALPNTLDLAASQRVRRPCP